MNNKGWLYYSFSHVNPDSIRSTGVIEEDGGWINPSSDISQRDSLSSFHSLLINLEKFAVVIYRTIFILNF